VSFAGTLREARESRALPWLLPAFISLSSGVAWILSGPAMLLAGLVGGGLILVALASFSWTLSLVLVGRTAMDLLWENNLYAGGLRISAASIFSLIIVLVVLATMLARRKAVRSSDGAWAVVLLILGSAVGTITAYARFGDEANMAARELVRLLVLLCWYLFLYQHSRETGDSRPFRRAVLLACALPLALGLWDVFTASGIEMAGVVRVSSTFVDPNAFGFYLVFLLMFCFAWIAGGGKKLALLITAIGLWLLVCTYSRGAWISLAIAVPIFWLKVSRRRFVVVVILALVIVTAYPVLSARLASVDYADIVKESRTEVTSNSYSFRVMIWKRLLELWTEHPMLGWGLETTPLINPILSELDGRGAAAHNDGVRYLVETGLVGTCFYLGFLWVLGRKAYRGMVLLQNDSLRHLALASVVIFVAFVVQSLTVAEPLHASIFTFHFLGLLAVVEGCADRLAGARNQDSVAAPPGAPADLSRGRHA
jgi:O-antigen ligase